MKKEKVNVIGSEIMGTNYYICCKYCRKELKHIGKNSNNKFNANMTKSEFINLKLKEHEIIINEYGEEITKLEMLKRVFYDWVLVHINGEWC